MSHPTSPIGFDHPCRGTCSGWLQGYERGKEELLVIQKESDEIKNQALPLIGENARLREALIKVQQWYDTQYKKAGDRYSHHPVAMLAREALSKSGHSTQAAPRCKHDIHGNDCVKCYPSEVK